MNLRQTAPNVSKRRDTPDLPIHRDSGLVTSSLPGLPGTSGVTTESVQNPYKSDRFRELQFTTGYGAATYNFNALKCTDFIGTTDFRTLCILSTLNPQLSAGSASLRLCCESKLLNKTDRF